jgi:hypothetical protein
MPFVSNGPTNTKPLEEKLDKLHELMNKKKWWEQSWVQTIAFISAIAGIISFYNLFK